MAACSGDSTTDEPDKPAPSPNPDPDVTTYSINGNVQKGPFTQGTSITIQALDEALNPTGKNYQTKTTDDAGTFKISNQIESRYVEIIATGYYFNEISGRVSNSTITLRSLSDLTETGKTNVNLLTTLESDRIRNLVISEGKTVQNAREQAEKELFAVFHIPNAVSASAGFDKMDITKGGESNAILLALSATLQGERTEGELSELISKIASEIESSGSIQNEIITEQIRTGGMTVNAESVRDNLEARYKALGFTDYEIPPFEDYLDVNGNGSIDKQDDWLVLSENDFQISDEGGIIEVNLQHNIEYDVTIEDDGSRWITNNTTRAFLETDKLIFTVKKNDTYDARYARIAIKDRNSSYTEYITVSQKQLDALTVTSNRFEVAKNGGTIDVEVKANVSYTIEIPSEYRSWISQTSTTRGLTAKTLQFNIARSDEANVREGKIIIQNGSQSETITVYQTGEKVLVLNQKEYTVSDEGATINVEVTSNIDYEIVMPSANWISETQKTRGIITNTRSFTIASNTTYDARDAEIIFRDKNSNLQETVIVYQTQKDAIIVAKKSYNFDNAGGNLTLTLQANVDVEIEIPEASQPWISPIPQTRALTEKTLNFTIAANSGYDKREGEIIVKSAQKELTETIKIYQTQKNAIILTQNEYTLSEQGGDFSIEVKSNIDFSVSVSGGDSWLHQITTRSLVSHTLNFKADANTTYDSRDATITITNTANNLKETIKVHQSQKDALIVGTDKFEVPYTGGDVIVNVKSNVGYNVSVTEGAEWISRAPETRALTESTVTLKIAKNETYKQRTGKVKIQDITSGINNVITITQAANANVQTIHVEVAGTLSEIISTEDLQQIINLKITGQLNETDILMLSPKDAKLDATKFKTETLDVSGVTFDNSTLSGFNGLPYLKEIHLPPSLKKIQGSKGSFDGCTSLTTIDFGENTQLEVLGSGIWQNIMGTLDNALVYCGAFSNCTSLKKIDIPASVTTIEGGAFYGSGIETINFADNCNIESFDAIKVSYMNQLGGIQTILIGTFYGCSQLKTIDIPSSVDMITESAFKGWTGLETLEIPETVKYFSPESLFSGCRNLKYVSLPSSLTTIGASMFAGCTNLTSFDFAAGYTKIGKNAFLGCMNLTTIDLEGVTEIAGGAFSGCGFTHIRIPDSMIEIPNSLFYNCEKLETVDFNKTEIIRGFAFQGCPLTAVSLPASVKQIDSYAFDCPDLEDVRLEGGAIVLEGSAFFKQGSDSKPIKALFIGKDVTSLTTSGGSFSIFNPDFNNFIFEDGSKCEEFGICVGLNLTTINLPPSVTKLGCSAFKECPNLTNIESILQNIKEIGEFAFSGTNISSVDIPEGVEAIGPYAFYQCKNLRRFNLPSTLCELGAAAFARNPQLVTSTLNGTNLKLNKSQSYQRIGIFEDCQFISKITIGKNILTIDTEIDTWGYLMSKNIKEIVFEDDSKCMSISGPVFLGTDGGSSQLTSITLPAGLTTIGRYVFQNCWLLSSITIPENVNSIGYYAFRDCRGLTSVIIPESTTSIESYAFAKCTSLKSVYCKASVPPTLEKIGRYNDIFYDDYIPQIFVPKESVEAYKEKWVKYKNYIIGYDY